jgi:hypothetical protein
VICDTRVVQTDGTLVAFSRFAKGDGRFTLDLCCIADYAKIESDLLAIILDTSVALLETNDNIPYSIPQNNMSASLKTEPKSPVRSCPACAQLADHTLRFRVNDCNIFQCRNCGLARTDISAFDPATCYTSAYFSGDHSKRFLRPGGVIVITTGDFESHLARLAGAHWRLMTPPQHLWFFTRTSVRQLAAGLGLSLEFMDRPWKIVPLSLIFFQLRRMLGLRPKPAPAGRIGIPLNLFDTMRIVLRKPELGEPRLGKPAQ